MVKLYTSSDCFTPDDILLDNESFFYNISIGDMPKEFEDVIKDIDSASMVDFSLGKIETPYGIAGIEDLSTGCKTVINTLYIHQRCSDYPNIRAVNLTECGWNALEKVFSYVDKYNIQLSFILEHDNELYRCSEREYLINGKVKQSNLDYYWGYSQR